MSGETIAFLRCAQFQLFSEALSHSCMSLCFYSSQVLFSISQKMIQHQIANYTDILKWLKQILTCRNEFLSRHKEYANVGTHIPICKQAHIKLEVRVPI